MTDNTTAPAADIADPTDKEIAEYFDNKGEVPEVETPNLEAEAKEAVEPEPVKEQVKTVPHQALHEERERRKELARQLEETQAKQRLMEERFAKFLEEKQAPPPNVDENPVEYLKYTEKQLREQQERLAQEFEAQRVQREQESQWNNFVTAYRNQAQQFAEQTPDFDAAYQHALKTRIAEFVAGGVDEATAKTWATQEETAIVQRAFQDGVNPAERIYNMAKARGYTPKAQADNSAKMETLIKGTQSKSLAGVGGQSPAPMSLEALAEMDDAEFEKHFEKIMKG